MNRISARVNRYITLETMTVRHSIQDTLVNARTWQPRKRVTRLPSCSAEKREARCKAYTESAQLISTVTCVCGLHKKTQHKDCIHCTNASKHIKPRPVESFALLANVIVNWLCIGNVSGISLWLSDLIQWNLDRRWMRSTLLLNAKRISTQRSHSDGYK